jgi:hypothetical protein
VVLDFDGIHANTVDIKLIDFGNACKVGDDETLEQENGMKREGEVWRGRVQCFPIRYMDLSPPEVLEDNRFSTPRDVWAAGLCMLHIVSFLPLAPSPLHKYFFFFLLSVHFLSLKD